MKIKRWIYQKELGYNEDYTLLWIKAVVELQTGDKITVYFSVNLQTQAEGEWQKQPPRITHEIT